MIQGLGVKSMSGSANIHLNPKNLESCDIKDVYLPPHERIGFLYHRLVTLVDQKEDNRPEINKLLGFLGVYEEDQQAQAFFIDFFYQLKVGKVQVIPSTKTEGMYFLEVDGVKKWVFKPGEKRGYTETLVRKVAKAANLAGHTLESMYCSLKVTGDQKVVSQAEESDNESVSSSSSRFPGFRFFSVGVEGGESDDESVSSSSSSSSSVAESEKSDDDVVEEGKKSDDGWSCASAAAEADWGDLFSNPLMTDGKEGLLNKGSMDPSTKITESAAEEHEEILDKKEAKQGPIITDLFNGLTQQTRMNRHKGGFLTGTIERFEEKEIDLSNPASVTEALILMAILGLRDVSQDNVRGGKRVVYSDTEDAFPAPPEFSESEAEVKLDDTALFQLGLFIKEGDQEDPILREPVKIKDLCFNQEISPTKLMNLMQKKILFFDEEAEKKLKPILVCEATGEEEEIEVKTDEKGKLTFKSEKFQALVDQITTGKDQMVPAGWHFKVSNGDSAGKQSFLVIPAKHVISGYLSYLKGESQRPVMPSQVIDGVVERAMRIKELINKVKTNPEKEITPLDVLEAADPRFKYQFENSPSHYRRRLTEDEFLHMAEFEGKEGAAKDAHKEYDRVNGATPLVVIGTEPSRDYGLTSPPPSVSSSEGNGAAGHPSVRKRAQTVTPVLSSGMGLDGSSSK